MIYRIRWNNKGLWILGLTRFDTEHDAIRQAAIWQHLFADNHYRVEASAEVS
jgi:hypothetical protein